MLGFKRQDQALDVSIVVFDDTDETYQLLLCFGKWRYLGNKSWNFPDSASAIYFATLWLQRNKDKFVNAVKNVDKGASIPSYIKAAMIGKVYKLILNGRIGDAKLNQLGDETFLSVDTPKNSAYEFSIGHSQKWYELHQLIYNDPITRDSYTASVRYFKAKNSELIKGLNIIVLVHPSPSVVRSCITTINKCEKWPLTQESIDSYMEARQKADDLLKEMRFDDEIRDFLIKVRDKRATLSDIAPSILEWIHSENIADKVSLSIRNTMVRWKYRKSYKKTTDVNEL